MLNGFAKEEDRTSTAARAETDPTTRSASTKGMLRREGLGLSVFKRFDSYHGEQD
jgi:hypothetical protein